MERFLISVGQEIADMGIKPDPKQDYGHGSLQNAGSSLTNPEMMFHQCRAAPPIWDTLEAPHDKEAWCELD